MNSGKVVILVILSVGVAAGLSASIYWSQPEHAVAGSFAQIHAKILRGPKDKALRLLAPTVVLNGKSLTKEEFVASYELPPDGDRIEVTPCASMPDHWMLAMKNRRYCFFKDGRTWKLHWVEDGACHCK